MCWNTDLHVVLQKDTPAARNSLTHSTGPSFLVLEGTFPAYRVTNGVCGCGAVSEPNGTSVVDSTLDFVRHFLAQPIVKRVELRWWWGDDRNRPTTDVERRLTLADFESQNANESLTTGVIYRINNPAAFRGRRG